MAKPQDKYSTYAERQKERGLKKIHVWIPETEEDNVKAYCERKRKAHAKKAA